MAAKAVKLPEAIVTAAVADGFIPGMQVWGTAWHGSHKTGGRPEIGWGTLNLLGSVGFCWVLLGSVRFCWVLLGSI